MPRLAISPAFPRELNGLAWPAHKDVVAAIRRFLAGAPDAPVPERVRHARDPRVVTLRLSDGLRAVALREGDLYWFITLLPEDRAWAYARRHRYTVNRAIGVVESWDAEALDEIEPALRRAAAATDRRLLGANESWLQRVQVPASVANLLEFRLGESGHDAMGYAAHVPHYLAQAEYPQAAVTALDAISLCTGLIFPMDELRAAAAKTTAEIQEQIQASEELATAIKGLEQQYDAFTGGAQRDDLLENIRVPTGEELAAQFERFLAEREERLHAAMLAAATDHERVLALNRELRGIVDERESLELEWLEAADLVS